MYYMNLLSTELGEFYPIAVYYRGWIRPISDQLLNA